MRTAKALSLAVLVLVLISGAIVFAQPSIVWQKCLGGSSDDEPFSIQQISDGGFIVAGVSCSNDGDVSGNHGFYDFWVVKLNSSGDIVWQKCLGGSGYDEAQFIQQTSDGGFIVAGVTESNDGDVRGNHGGADFWVVRLNSSGDIVWQKCLGGSRDDRAYSIQQTLDGGFIVAGFTWSNDDDVSGHHGSDSTTDYWVVKLDSSGNIEWQKCLGGSGMDLAISIQQTSDGGFIVAGHTESDDGDVSGNHGETDFWVVKLNSSGSIVWKKCLGGSGWEGTFVYPCDVFIRQTSDGGFIMAGGTESNDGDVSGNHGERDYWIVKLDSSGNIEWQKCLGGSGWEGAHLFSEDLYRVVSIQQTSDGGFIMAGVTWSNDGDVSGNHGENDFWVVKLNSSGNIVWQKCLGGGFWDVAHFVQQTSDGGFIVAGCTWSNDGDVSGNHGFVDYWVVKLSPVGVSENVIVPEQFAVSVFPNPFNSSCIITAPSGAKIEIYDLRGRLISKGIQPFAESQGKRTLIWQPDETIQSGVYIVRATMENGRKKLKRVVLVK